MRKFFQGWFLAAELMLLGCVGAAYANYDGTQGTGTHFVAFDATHSGTSLCAAANTQCVAFAVIDSAGAEKFTAANPATVTAIGIAQGSTTSGQTGSLVMGAVTTAPPTYTTAQSSPASLTPAGGLRTDNLSWAGTTLGAPSNYGTSPGAVAVPGVNAFVTNFGAVTSGGSTPYTPFVPTASDNHQVAKNGAGTSYSVTVSNNSATKNYLRLYDAGTGFNGCNSATGVIFAMEIPPTDSGFTVLTGGVNGLSFSTGLSLCVTSGFGLTDTTNATATAMYVNVAYK